MITTTTTKTNKNGFTMLCIVSNFVGMAKIDIIEFVSFSNQNKKHYMVIKTTIIFMIIDKAQYIKKK